MKKILLSVIGTGLFAFPLLSAANGVLCSIDVALNPVVIVGSATAFQATCINNTSNRNYTDFTVLSPTSSVTVGTSCGNYLPVGGSCVVTGVFTPSSAADNNFTLGLNYGGTNYPAYPSLSFSTTVSTINFTPTLGPNGGDTLMGGYARIPGGNNGLYYVLGTNHDVGQSDIYIFTNGVFLATDFPLSTINGTDFSSSVIMAADGNANLYVGAVVNGSLTAADAIWVLNFETGLWSSTNFNATTMGNVVDITINSENKVFATTSNGGATQVWEFDPVAVTWANTGFPATLTAFSLNQKTTYLLPDSAGLIYGKTATTIYSYLPSPVPGVGTWTNTLASVPFTAVSSFFIDTSDIVYAAGTAGGSYNIYFLTPPTTWTSTTFQTDTTLSAPNYPSFIDTGSGEILASGLRAGVLEVWKLTPPTTWVTTSFPGTETDISFQVLGSSDFLYANSFNTTGVALKIWQYSVTGNTWSSLNFPIASNKTIVNMLTVDESNNLYALMWNGSYILPTGSATWLESNSGLYALTSRYQEILNGTLFTLNARQATSPTCSVPGTSGDPNSTYDSDWSDFPDQGGFIDVFKYPLTGPWATTGFPNTTGPSYIFNPLVSNNNDVYGLVFTSPGPNDIYRYTTSWTSTSFPSGPTVYPCMQGALVTDPDSNLYAVTYSGTTYTIRKYTEATSTWSSTTGIPAATLVRQLKVDASGTPWAIVGTDVYTYNGTTWTSTSFPVLAGAPKHLSNDSDNNLYAVTNSVQVWKYTAATATWGNAMLGGTGIPASAGKIYRQLRTDSANNLYARTRNTTTDVDSVWKYTAASDTWSDLSSLNGFPTGAIIQDLSIDSSGNVFISTSLGLYVYSGSSWFELNSAFTDRLLVNSAGNYYQVTNNAGVYLGALT